MLQTLNEDPKESYQLVENGRNGLKSSSSGRVTSDFFFLQSSPLVYLSV